MLWDAVESCSSQRLLYPALSAFAEVFSKLKGLNPYYTLQACLDHTIAYGTFPSMSELKELLAKEKQHLSFLLDYFQLESVLRFVKSDEEKLVIIKSATNYAQIIILSLYNFLVTIPTLARADFIEWCKLFENAVEKTIDTHELLLEYEPSEEGKIIAIISESSLHSLRTQLYLLKARYLNEKGREALTYANIETSAALQDLQPYLDHPQFKETVRIYYNQQKALFLETHFYQILSDYVLTQFKNSMFIGDRKDDKKSLTRSNLKFQVEEILNEIYGFISEIQETNKEEYIGVSSNLINIYSKIVFGAYVYDLVDEAQQMEELTKTRRLDIS
ncbi:MAG: hypothetical protein ACTSPI_18200, partial [Candidatus Heimdallarchaeaceae archaeon]